MMSAARTMKALADETRLRIMMLLDGRELCVYQLMGILGVSQPLVSRNLSQLAREGLVRVRREGKLAYYTVQGGLHPHAESLIRILRAMTADDPVCRGDLEALGDCMEFHRQRGRCDMDEYREFMMLRRRGRLAQ